MRYEEVIAEDIKGWLGQKWSELTDPAMKAARQFSGDTKEDIADNFALLIQVASRYQDDRGNLIKPRTLQQTPIRAVYSYLRGNMGLDNHDIAWIIKKLGGAPGMALDPVKLNDDKPLYKIFRSDTVPFDAAMAKKFLKAVAQLATIRLYEKNRLKSASKDQDTTAEEPKASKASTWSPGQAITKKDGTVIMPDDPKYKTIAANYAWLISQGVI